MGENSGETSGSNPSGAAENTTLLPARNDGFKAIGPDPIGKKKKKYKFVEPPGIMTWVISFAKKCLACGLIYAFGYFRISVGWLVGPIVLMVVRDQWRRHHDAKRAIAQAAAKGDEREIILARLGDNLPSWVIFPDVERAEWLNMIIKQLWPRINHYVYDLVVQSIEPGLRDTLANSYKMGSFRFEKVILGDTPVRVRGVKVYDEKKTDRNEIIMDMEVIYAGDCDVRFSLSKVRAGIKDLQLHGTLRLVMKPLVNQMPLIGGIQYFFLNPPSLDFNLIGVADVLDMPGLADLIRRIVQEQIAAMCVLPNKMFVQLAENVNAQETCALRPQGVIRICAVEARNLLKKDVGVLGMGKSDPYVVLSVGAQSFKSKIINNTVTPKWDFNCEMMVEEIGQNLIVYVYDYDEMPRQDEFLGRCLFPQTNAKEPNMQKIPLFPAEL
ncbi:Extended synaptotagmin-2 [Orchesella cincta]|uniref:Extended synaptotagmin-2 n=1 Tax=Orchesella cincta TaxID=48709 RepID=A0A1D2NKH9_ORCCI|nr:Extended synaptotagmin-2 [Orchesella cincta]